MITEIEKLQFIVKNQQEKITKMERDIQNLHEAMMVLKEKHLLD